jgi:chromosomal replication initiator protein
MLDNNPCVQEIWDSACLFLKDISLSTYEQWFRSVVPVSIKGSDIVLGVSDDFFAEWMQENYRDIIVEALEQATSREFSVSFISGYLTEQESINYTDDGDELDLFDESFYEEDLASKDIFAPNCDDNHTFNSFVVGEGNRFAFNAALVGADSPGTYNPLFIYGGTGLGKTHLLQAIANQYIKNHPKAVVEYIQCEELVNLYIDSLRMKRHYEFRNRFRSADILLVDDIHFLAKGTQIQEEFFNTFNTLYNQNKQIVLSSDKQPCEINGLESRLVSRFEFGVTTEIIIPSVETRLAILKKKQETQLKKIDEEVLYFIASRITSNIRFLEGALLRLVAYSSLTNSNITVAIAEQLLGNLLEEEAANRKISIENIQRRVAEFYDIGVHDILGRKRPKNIAEPRMIAMYLSRKLTGHSFPEIAQAFGGKNHATVISAVKRVDLLCNKDENIKRDVGTLKRKLQEGSPA